ncbi:hypothetical protein SFRURICE_006813 [Spodoptera frugiperda]|nr:hypothetical protein SFRURICE_006813 [Spodoptera frugiperda]
MYRKFLFHARKWGNAKSDSNVCFFKVYIPLCSVNPLIKSFRTCFAYVIVLFQKYVSELTTVRDCVPTCSEKEGKTFNNFSRLENHPVATPAFRARAPISIFDIPLQPKYRCNSCKPGSTVNTTMKTPEH